MLHWHCCCYFVMSYSLKVKGFYIFWMCSRILTTASLQAGTKVLSSFLRDIWPSNRSTTDQIFYLATDWSWLTLNLKHVGSVSLTMAMWTFTDIWYSRTSLWLEWLGCSAPPSQPQYLQWWTTHKSTMFRLQHPLPPCSKTSVHIHDFSTQYHLLQCSMKQWWHSWESFNGEKLDWFTTQ